MSEPKAIYPNTAQTTISLPVVYDRWIKAIIQAPLPEESEATCDNCVMCSCSGEPVDNDQSFFDNNTKCCTYTPTLSNFMVGAILLDTTSSMTKGRATLVERLDKGLGVTPVAVQPPPAYKLLYRHSQHAFGRNSTLRCPHLDCTKGTCTIWPYRDPNCATWFCKHYRGKIGQAFWRAALHFLNAVTSEISLWCVLQLNPGDEALALIDAIRERSNSCENLAPNELDGRLDATTARKVWGRWWQRQSAFYMECGKMVTNLNFQEVERICGPGLQISYRLLKEAYNKLQEPHIPTHLRIGRFQVEEANVDTVRVWSYSRFDPLDLPVPVFMALSYFDGRPTEEALAMVEHDLGTHLDDQSLGMLIDFGMLKLRQGA
jgi:hypothetical protein